MADAKVVVIVPQIALLGDGWTEEKPDRLSNRLGWLTYITRLLGVHTRPIDKHE